MTNIRNNIDDLKGRIAEAAQRSGRDPDDVLLLAVSKTIPAERIEAAWRAGQGHFGENRVQEARQKVPVLPGEIAWHLVGHLQKNKSKYCPGLFSWIHSVDSVPLAEELAKRYEAAWKICRVLVQVNVSGEEVKSGCRPDEAEKIVSAVMGKSSLAACGLMTMPPLTPDPEDARPHFARLRKIRDDLADRGLGDEGFRELSMGMSGDFEVAVEEGATIVRVGTAVFGGRHA